MSPGEIWRYISGYIISPKQAFHIDQSRLFEELDGKERPDLKPDGEQTNEFWSEIWSKPFFYLFLI